MSIMKAVSSYDRVAVTFMQETPKLINNDQCNVSESIKTNFSWT